MAAVLFCFFQELLYFIILGDPEEQLKNVWQVQLSGSDITLLIYLSSVFYWEIIADTQLGFGSIRPKAKGLDFGSFFFLISL